MRSTLISLYEKATAPQMGWMERFHSVKQAGFDGLEISLDETEMRLSRLTWPTRVVHDLRSCAFDEDVRLTGMRLSALRRYALGSGDPGTAQQAQALLLRAVDWAVEAGVPLIQVPLVDAYGEPTCERTEARLRERLADGVAAAARAGVMLALSPMPDQAFDTLDKAAALVTALGSPFVALYPDIKLIADASALQARDADAPEPDAPGAGRIVAVSTAEAAAGLRAARALGILRFTAMIWFQDRPDWSTMLLTAAQAMTGALGDS